MTVMSTFTELAPFLRYALLAVFAIYAITQVRKPSKWAGRPFLWLMNSSHSDLTDWGLQHVQIEKNSTILDVGCGGGRTIQKLATAAAQGKVHGVDYASGSVAASRAKNAKLIQQGRVEIKQASVSQLPFPENNFDLVTAVETQYYWPNLVKDMREVLRVLKPGGTLIIIAESYKKGGHENWKGMAMKLVRSTSLSADDQRALFSAAGFRDIQILEEPSKGWICATGKKAP
jgi:ubiquinone/menaquinone biosynthesis C-methylase UbiE